MSRPTKVTPPQTRYYFNARNRSDGLNAYDILVRDWRLEELREAPNPEDVEEAFANVHVNLFKHKLADSRGITLKMLESYQILEKKGFQFDPNQSFAFYGTVLSSPESKAMLRDFLIFYRSYPEFLFNQASLFAKSGVKKILNDMSDPSLFHNVTQFHTIVAQTIDSAFMGGVLSEEEWIERRKDVLLKAMPDIAESDREVISETYGSAVMRPRLVGFPDPGQLHTVSEKPLMRLRAPILHPPASPLLGREDLLRRMRRNSQLDLERGLLPTSPITPPVAEEDDLSDLPPLEPDSPSAAPARTSNRLPNMSPLQVVEQRFFPSTDSLEEEAAAAPSTSVRVSRSRAATVLDSLREVRAQDDGRR